MNARAQSLGIASPWRTPIVAWLAVLVVLGLLFRETLASLVGIWVRSDTYAHCFLVPPISAWLVWRQREALATMTPRPWPWTLVPVTSMALLWLLGELAGVNAATQFAVVAILVLSVPASFGPEVSRRILFPLGFLLFAVPIGEFLTDVMIERTADFTVFALQVTGVPVYREGRSFVIPSGNWSVVEACSGVRYLIASFMVGTLFAYLNFSSMRRRLVFVAVSIAVPVVANWLRAYIIVMLGHLSGNKLAVGVDHLVYGWVFFGIVIMAMFMIGGKFADGDSSASVSTVSPQPAPASAVSHWSVAVLVALLLAGTQATKHHASRATRPENVALAMPPALSGGWLALPGDTGAWTPNYRGASASSLAMYQRDGVKVSVWVGFYRNQGYERKLVTSTNGLVASESRDWLVVSQFSESLPLVAGAAAQVRAAEIRSPADPQATARERLAVRSAYWIRGAVTSSDAEAKLRIAFGKLLGQGDDSAIVVVYSAETGAGGAGRTVSDFMSQHWQEIAGSLARSASQGAPAAP